VRARASHADAIRRGRDSTPCARWVCSIYRRRRRVIRRRRRVRRRVRRRRRRRRWDGWIDWFSRAKVIQARARRRRRRRDGRRHRACLGAVWMEGNICRRRARSFAVVRGRGRARASDATATHRQRPDARGCLFVGAISDLKIRASVWGGVRSF